MNEEYLFVYGTLRKDYGTKLAKTTSDKLLFLAEGKVAGALYDLGPYPAAVADREEEIKGDVYLLKDGVSVFAALDEYEGDEYRREKVTVSIADGQKLEGWMYWYTGQVAAEQRIAGNDYINYLKTKKTV